MDQLQNGLNKSQSGFEQRQDPELAKRFQDFSDQLEATAKEFAALVSALIPKTSS